MKLANLEISSSMRFTQPDLANDENQTMDIQFDLTRGATVDKQFYLLAFYEMLNGYSTGVDKESAVTAGIKFTIYDTDDNKIASTVPVKFDKITDENNIRLEAKAIKEITDMTTNKYINKIDVSFVANDGDVEKEFMVFESPSATTTVFAEKNSANKMGILIKGGSNTFASGEFILSFKS